jgi:hypothetical protein
MGSPLYGAAGCAKVVSADDRRIFGRRVVLTRWHAFMFLGLRFFPLFAWWPPLLFLVKQLLI